MEIAKLNPKAKRRITQLLAFSVEAKNLNQRVGQTFAGSGEVSRTYDLEA